MQAKAPEIPLKFVNGKSLDLGYFQGKVLLIVNTAIRCGFHYQEKQLIALAGHFIDHPFAILRCPSNDFRGQEPRSDQEIACELEKYPSNVWTLAKGSVKGVHATALYRYLRDHYHGFCLTPFVPWNYTKFLLGRQGNVVRRFLPLTPISRVRRSIQKELYGI